MKQMLLGSSPIGMKRNLGKVAIALLFISAAITCSLTTWATSPEYGTAPGIGKTSPTGTMPNLTRDNPANPLLGECVGEPRVTLTSPFASDYTCTNLGSLPVPFPWGALTLKYDDPNTLLIGGNANSANGRIYPDCSHARREQSYHRLFRRGYGVSGAELNDWSIQRWRRRIWTREFALCNSLP